MNLLGALPRSSENKSIYFFKPGENQSIRIYVTMLGSFFTQYYPRKTHPYTLEPLLAGLWPARLHLQTFETEQMP